MDIHNNGQGIAIFDNFQSQLLACNLACRLFITPTLLQAVNEKLRDGDLKYIIIDPDHSTDSGYDRLVPTTIAGTSRF